ncbi:MAG TPA: hypothetical protein VLI46_02745 [Ramlibacter sp.]|nr:hypothetical protein [Ramlibacter sp.]
MAAHPEAFDDHDLGNHAPAISQADAGKEDAYWRRTFRREGYVKPGLDYEDYAPAYCVGYTGYAQYGGDFEQAENSLWANWIRIKGDSRLSPDDARQAMRAAWNRMGGQRQRFAIRKPLPARLRRRLGMPSFRLSLVAPR